MVDFLANKAPKSHKAMLISQGFNPETADLTTFVEHCERVETTDSIASAKIVSSDEEHEPKTKKRSKSKSDCGKKRPKRSSKKYCTHHGENTTHTTKDCNILKAKNKTRPKFSKKDFKKRSKEFNLIEKKASLEKAKYHALLLQSVLKT